MDKFPNFTESPPDTTPEKQGVFERWFKRRKIPSPEAPPPNPTPEQQVPKEQAVPRGERLAKGVMRLLGIGGNERVSPEARATEATEKPHIENIAKTTRVLGEVTLKFVRGLLNGEGTPQARHETNLQDAAEDLSGALDELNESMNHLPPPDAAKPERQAAATPEMGDPTSGFYDRHETAPAGTPIASRAAEITPLVEAKEKVKHAFAIAGLGVAAVGATLIFAFERCQAAKERQRHERELRSDRKLLRAEQSQLRKQQKALEKLQETPPSPVPEVQYFNQVSEFTHKQANITRDVAEEVRHQTPLEQQPIPAQPAVEQFRLPAQRAETIVQPAERAMMAEKLAPVVTVERGDRIEYGPGGQHTTSQQSQGMTAASGGMGAQPVSDPAANQPLDPQGVRQEAQRRNAALRRSQFAWLAGIALFGGIVGFLLLFVLFG